MEKRIRETSPQKDKRKAGKILIPLLILVLAVAFYVGIEIWYGYRDSVIDAQKQQMLLTVQGLRDSMEVFLRGYMEDLEGLYQTADKSWLWEKEPEETSGKRQDSSENLFSEYVNSHEPMVWDVMVEDERGNLFKMTKKLKPGKVYSTSRIDSNKSLQMAEMENGEKYLILRMEIPGKGAILLILDLEEYYQALMQRQHVGTNGYMVLKDRNGIILMHPERAQWGIEVIDGRMEMYENLDLNSLRTMIDHQKEGLEGVDEYYSYWWMKEGYPRVRKLGAYCPVVLGEDFLVLSAVIDYNDIYIPVVRGVFQLFILFLVFFLVMVAMAVYIVYMMMMMQKDTEQITYLTELNRLLEKMHQSEEAIAHQQRLQIMGTMTGGIAHEFNNLLTPIMGYADLLLMELDENSESYDNALEICEASQKAKEIIQQIATLSRKNMETAYKNANAASVIVRALKMVRSVCPANVSLKEEISLGEVFILCNETQMNQVFLNICVNAIHAIGHKEGIVRVCAYVINREELEKLNSENLHLSQITDNWEHYVCIQIRDNGCGMSKEVLNRIFDPFFTTKKGGKGTGLGLSLVEQIINSHRGGIYVESELGKGSIFSIYLPVNEQDYGVGREGEENELGAEANQGELPEKKNGLRLLIVDDNPKVLQLLKKDGDRLSVTMECRMSFEEARKVLEESKGLDGLGQIPFDALVTELEIEGQSAVDFCMAIRGRYPDLALIVMTDRVTRELAEAGQRGILDGYIDKPVSISSILKALKDV